jgi:hypothetical protein
LESWVFDDGVFTGAEGANHPAEEMSERRDHSKNLTGTVQIERCTKSLILQVYDVWARHKRIRPRDSRQFFYGFPSEALGDLSQCRLFTFRKKQSTLDLTCDWRIVISPMIP